MAGMVSRRLAIAILVVLLVANAYIDSLLVEGLKRVAASRVRPIEQHSFVGEDYPARVPLQSARPAVRLSVEESVRYWISTNESSKEWMYMATVGDNNVHLGPNKRYFSIALTHEIHCLNALRDALADDQSPVGHAAGHLAHCLSYLRQSTLCASDTTLEPADMMGTYDRIGGDRRCMDWPAFYQTMKLNWREWVYWKRAFFNKTG